MTNINALFPSKYLKAADLKRPDGTNASMTLTIERVVVEQIMDNKPDVKPCLYFVGKTKGMVLNKTNGLMIAHSYGEEVERWAGLPIQLYVEATQFEGRIVDAIRVRVPQTAQTVEPTAKAVATYEREQVDTANTTNPAMDDFDDDDIPF